MALLSGKVILISGASDRAKTGSLEKLRDAVVARPDNPLIRQLFARALSSADDLESAAMQFEKAAELFVEPGKKWELPQSGAFEFGADRTI